VNDICVGPNGGCPLCYYNPCRCRETEAERVERERQERAAKKRRKAHGTEIELLDCKSCGQYGVVPDDVTRAYICLKCGVTQQPNWIAPKSGWEILAGPDGRRAPDWQPVLDEMSRLMQPEAGTGRYLDAAETWNSLLEFVRRGAVAAPPERSEPTLDKKEDA